MSNLNTLYDQFGVSPWLDSLSRDMIIDGKLQKYVSHGIRGVTSNPSIFEKALKEGKSYKEPFGKLIESGMSAEEAYWVLAIEDIQNACDILLEVHESSLGNDGFVSLEVSPEYAHNPSKTIEQAMELWSKVDRPNLMIKIPATAECIPAISEVISKGINVNVTLIFSLHRYLQVINAYMEGLERLSNPSRVRSVASFFVSRVDTLVDEKLKDPRLNGLAAVAQARVAYGIFLESFNSNANRWMNLEQKGAAVQRPLWASTSTKNPLYPELKYVDGLLTQNTVNTLPENTIGAILNKAQFDNKNSLTASDIELAHEDLDRLKLAGIDMDYISSELEKDGVAKFQKAFSDMLNSLQ